MKTNNQIMEEKILTAKLLLEDVLGLVAELKKLPPKRDMTLKEFKLFVGTKSNAMVLAKQCNIGHSVFVDLLNPHTPNRVMRANTKDRILIGLNIVIVD